MINSNVSLKDVYDHLTILSLAPDSQIDGTITDRLKKLIGKPIDDEFKSEVRHIIDDCVNYGLSSKIGLISLHILYEVMLDGKQEDFNDENNPWRKN
jgi:hypothetical protein